MEKKLIALIIVVLAIALGASFALGYMWHKDQSDTEQSNFQQYVDELRADFYVVSEEDWIVWVAENPSSYHKCDDWEDFNDFLESKKSEYEATIVYVDFHNRVFWFEYISEYSSRYTYYVYINSS